MKHGPQFSNVDNATLVIARIIFFCFLIFTAFVWLVSCTPQAVKEADKKLEQDQKKAEEFQEIAESNDAPKIRKSLVECSAKLKVSANENRDSRVENSGLREENKALKEEVANAQPAIVFYRRFWMIFGGAVALAVVSFFVKWKFFSNPVDLLK